MTNTAIVLAGGLGTRLRSVINDLPKPMAPVNEKPFLEYILDWLNDQNFSHCILSVGFRNEFIQDYFKKKYKNLSLEYSIENEPLGTGGGIQKACLLSKENETLIVNGDTYFNIDCKNFYKKHQWANADISIALKPMKHIERYGTVEINAVNRILHFKEKQKLKEGLINGGIYFLKIKKLLDLKLPEKFSFEKSFLETNAISNQIFGFPFEKYFIDIGIPEDYARAQYELPQLISRKEWTLFLDRDGVLNKRIANDYVKNVREFEWLPGSLRALKILSEFFGKIIIVSNQQGIGKGLMSENDLKVIHEKMLNDISQNDGGVDAVYFAPQLKTENSAYRKPEIGMALQAKKDFAGIDFLKSVMAGDSSSDLQFGRNAEMINVFVNTENINVDEKLFDYEFPDLLSFAQSLLS
jgi:D-glycero-alpha-D-manno-heptose 1-phosphate guanylyltransferase